LKKKGAASGEKKNEREKGNAHELERCSAALGIATAAAAGLAHSVAVSLRETPPCESSNGRGTQPAGRRLQSRGGVAGFVAQILNDETQPRIQVQLFEHLLTAHRIVNESRSHQVRQHR
jgi:hypothetical protein